MNIRHKEHILFNALDLPSSFTSSMKQLLGAEYDDFLNTYNEKPFSGIRFNDLKVNEGDIKKLLASSCERIPWVNNGYYIKSEKEYSKNPAYFAGLYYIQEPSAMTPASLLGTKPGDRVLDLCAAPGGKSTQIGADLKGEGVLISNDISATRAKALLKNIELFGIGNAYVTTESPEKLSSIYKEYFDRILIDAPCSGEGMFRKSPAVIRYYLEKGPEFYSKLQSEILDYAADMLMPGGTMVYSTCTFSVLEDEENIISFLNRHSEFYIDNIEEKPGFTPSSILPGSIRLYPHKCNGEGHFVCRLKKKGEPTIKALSDYSSKVKINSEAKDFLSCINRSFDESRFYINNDYLFFVPEYSSPNNQLRYLRTGLLLGNVKNNRFEPSQALAMNLKPSEWNNPLVLSKGDERVYRYLKGETIQADDSYKGYRLLCMDEFPLGFVKQDGSRCKNKYLAGWRWL